jgi:short-subunit dehydrogenase
MKKVLVTGTSKGLGRALTLNLINNDCQVFGVFRDLKQFQTFEKSQQERIIPVIADLSTDGCINIIQNVIEKTPIDLLINNAGTGGRNFTLKTASSQELLELFQIHCLGAFRVTKSIIDNLLSTTDPTVININSRLGSITEQSKGSFSHLQVSYSYRIAKAAQNMLTNCLRSEFRNEIKFYSIHPGRLITELSQTDADLTVEVAAERIVAAWKHGDLEDDTGIIEIGSKGYNW